MLRILSITIKSIFGAIIVLALGHIIHYRGESLASRVQAMVDHFGIPPVETLKFSQSIRRLVQDSKIGSSSDQVVLSHSSLAKSAPVKPGPQISRENRQELREFLKKSGP